MHTKALNEHTATLAEHSKSLDDHTSALAEHTRILNDQTQSLTEHGKMLREILDRLRWIRPAPRAPGGRTGCGRARRTGRPPRAVHRACRAR